MNWGKFAVVALLASGLVGGVGLWWTQTHQYWDTDPEAVIQVTDTGGAVTTFELRFLQAIRSASSPLGFRACFETTARPDLPNTLIVVEKPEPTVPPGWFDCFAPRAIADSIRAGEATAYIGVKNIAYGVDRIVAIYPDGRGYAWHELNNCGRKTYDGTVVGENCPDRATFEGTF